MYQSQGMSCQTPNLENITLLDKCSLQEYKESLSKSSNITSNLLLKEVWDKNTNNLNEHTMNYILSASKEGLKSPNNDISNTWKSDLSNIDPLRIFESSLPACDKCTYTETNTTSTSIGISCQCYHNQHYNDNTSFKPLNRESSEDSRSCGERQLFKPTFSRPRVKRPIDVSKNVTNSNRNIEMDVDPKPVPTDEVIEDEEKAHKSNVAKITFKTAKEALLSSNPAARRTLGASRKAQAKFISPMLGAQEKQELAEPAVIDDRLKNIDPKMIELIENEIIDKGTPIGWEDIAGLEHAKSVIQEAVVWPLLRPDIFTGLRCPPRGILLFGPPGTGKTLIGKCIASQCRATFFSISSSSLTSKWIGDGEKMVRALFAVARCHQPAVVFMDEIDSLLSARGDAEHEASRRIKTEFLVQFDGTNTGEEERVLVVGATNRPHELDDAARRRLVKRLYIPLPDLQARHQIIHNLLSRERHSLSPADMRSISEQCEGYSGADVRSLCAEAAMGPVRSLADITSISASQVRPVNIQDFKSALQRVRPSVSQDDLGQYVKWNETYGHGV
ncbi:unnamed protein product [Danaus chrysippus]|uniref:(African queen) hypothetical protein n=1 Tax=Danaus chrysippus TaxID=151541 RepID=A0A8J2RF37_9NEOP|nr:unnamed protein product [Danaus chrysippus]